MRSSQKLDNRSSIKTKKGRNPLFIFLATVICFFLFSTQSEIRAQVPPPIPEHQEDKPLDGDTQGGALIEGKKNDPSLKELKKEIKKTKKSIAKKKSKKKKGN